jgi:hypothetical protein
MRDMETVEKIDDRSVDGYADINLSKDNCIVLNDNSSFLASSVDILHDLINYNIRNTLDAFRNGLIVMNHINFGNIEVIS